jgi:hypothetical protein
MVLKYSTTPANVGRSAKGATHTLALPAGSQDMRTAPTGTAELVRRNHLGAVETQWAQHRRGAWREIQPFKNRDGSWTWRETGGVVSQPLAWVPRRGK